MLCSCRCTHAVIASLQRPAHGFVQRRHRRVGGVGGGEDGFDVFVVDGVQRRALISTCRVPSPSPIPNRPRSALRRYPPRAREPPRGPRPSAESRTPVPQDASARGRLLVITGDVDVRTSHEVWPDGACERTIETLQIADITDAVARANGYNPPPNDEPYPRARSPEESVEEEEVPRPRGERKTKAELAAEDAAREEADEKSVIP